MNEEWGYNMWKDIQWLRLPKEELQDKQIIHGDLGGRFAYFRCEKELPLGARLTAAITAVSRYRLWVNGVPVLSGPCKGDMNRQYYETVELTDYLQAGRNVFAVQVLYQEPDMARDQTDECAAIYGVVGAGGGHALAICGDVLGLDGGIVDTISTGKAVWRVWLDHTNYLRSSEHTVYLGATEETIDFSQSPSDWKMDGFDDSTWHEAHVFGPVTPSALYQSVGLIPRTQVMPREIPLLDEVETHFAEVIHEGNQIILDAGFHVNGYPRFYLKGAAGTEVVITYLERFGDGCGERIDDIHQPFAGRQDRVILNGSPLCYEPFWVRTFRYIVLQMADGSLPQLASDPGYRKTGYPLRVESEMHSSAVWVEKVWDICLRTLQNCMLETYMDCPYYEQLQFIMDTRLQMLFTYAVSSDVRLVQKALLDFHCGQLPNGLLPGKTPSAYCQVISTFSLHYAFALWEYVAHTGDVVLGRKYRADIDRILEYYDSKIGADGLVGDIGPWAFIDWQDDWQEHSGVSPAYFSGPSTIINLMYAWALECAARLYETTGRCGTAAEYRQRRRSILQRVHELCYDTQCGMYRDGPECKQFSRHAQAWAVLNDMLDNTAGRKALQQATNCPPCSFAASYEWFRALEKVGMQEEMRSSLDVWIGLIDRGSTTCPEEPGHPRSECHAWSALPLYEMCRTMAGVRMENGQLLIAPCLFDLPDLSGCVITPVGKAMFQYQRKDDGIWTYQVQLPKGVKAVFRTPAGMEKIFVNDLTLSE